MSDALMFLVTVANVILSLTLIGTWSPVMGLLWFTIPFSLFGILLLWRPKVPKK